MRWITSGAVPVRTNVVSANRGGAITDVTFFEVGSGTAIVAVFVALILLSF